MGIFQAKPSMVEAEQIPETYGHEEPRKIIDWVSEDKAYIGSHYYGGFLTVYFLKTSIVAPIGRWLIKLGEGRYEVLTNDEFNARYSWIGPKEYYDAPYMVN